MAVDRESATRLAPSFGLLLTDFLPVLLSQWEVECDVSEQQQFLDVVILRRGRGRFAGRLPDGLDNLAAHNLITFKSHPRGAGRLAMKNWWATMSPTANS